MKALCINQYDSIYNAALLACEPAVPGPDEVLLRVVAASINPLDLKLISGRMSAIFPLKFPYILGTDVAGVVEAVGNSVQRFKPGDNLFGRMDPRRGGALADHAVVPAHHLSPIPEGLDAGLAAALPTAAGTAWQALHDIARVRTGHRVLIHAASGGVGTFAIQIAKLAGATVIATASEKNHALLKNLGADEVIDYRQEDFTRCVKDADIVLDLIGGDTLRRSWGIIRPGGILVTSIDRALTNNGAVRGAFVQLTTNAALLQNIALLVCAGKLRVITDTSYSLEQARNALEQVASGHVAGKVLVRVSPQPAGH
ncbi:NADP-dependent oxidoreductase [Sodalis sp. dw_96]|uniref:NADP-dependent oxidoreductase n=1 Tax=Sodalis sp. dw_96 TaxID=2719794 RepID=UPI001BD45403|nr:NADP-dependent oxidoreductase [Sodalis sp. dw_96]